MLCAAMGGVALMVFIFAAMRKNLEQQAEGANEVLTIHVTSPADMCVNDHIGFCVIDAADDQSISYPNEDTDPRIIPASPNSPKYEFLVSGADRIYLRIWLRRTNNGTLPLQITGIIKKGSEQIDEFKLDPSNLFMYISPPVQL